MGAKALREGIPCPHCGHGKSAVEDSRAKAPFIRRRRCCLNCQWTFGTLETVETSVSMTGLSSPQRTALRETTSALNAAIQSFNTLRRALK